MTDNPEKDPATKMRSLLGGSRKSPLTRLPKRDEPAAPFLPRPADEAQDPGTSTLKPPPMSGPAQSLPRSEPSQRGILFGPSFWTIASIISLTVNIILVIVLLALLISARRFNLGQVTALGNNLLGGLYANFEKMDRARITTNVQVNTTIPVKFDLQLNQQTSVVLSQDVTIDNAVVTVKTGGLNITNALTTIVLPKGTTLPIVLNLAVPVDTTVPVTLTVPVDIPLNQTQLHEPFSGLQDVIRPFYCMLDRGALNLDGQPVCQ